MSSSHCRVCEPVSPPITLLSYLRVVQRVITKYGSLETALFEADRTQIEREKSALEAALKSEPQLAEDRDEYTTVQRRTRDRAFRGLVLEAYDATCAVCGADRRAPDGTPEVEAAHIYPRSENGRDDVRNGIALCRLHHWAFDTGWIEITTDYTISVLENPVARSTTSSDSWMDRRCGDLIAGYPIRTMWWPDGNCKQFQSKNPPSPK